MKIQFKIIVSYLIIVFVLVGCDPKTELIDNTTKESSSLLSFTQTGEVLNVEKAKLWFENHVTVSDKNARKEDKPEKVVKWENALQFLSKKGEIYLQIPIEYKTKYVRLNYSESNKKELINLPTKILYLYPKGSTYTYYIVELVPDEKYLKKVEKKKFKMFDKKDYSGYFYVRDWDDKLKEGYLLENGKILNKIMPSDVKKNGKILACAQATNYTFSIGCLTYGNGSTSGGELVSYATQYMCFGLFCLPNAQSFANNLPKPTGYNCNYNNWYLTDTELFLYCSFDDFEIPDPITNFPFINTGGGVTSPSTAIWNALTLVDYFQTQFPLNINEINFYSNFHALIPQAIQNRNNANDAIEEFYCNNMDDYNGNAFKHAYWSALNTWSFGETTARIIGQLHESTAPSLIQADMDLYNNELGIQTALSYPAGIGEDQLKQILLSAIAHGSGRCLKPFPNNDPISSTLMQTTALNRCH